MQIIIHTIQSELKDKDILNLLVDSISKEFINTRVTIGSTLKFDIQGFIARQRNQVRSSDLITWF